MSITLGAFALPDGLVWSDELDWQPVEQSVSYGLDGALIVEAWPARQGGRPITLAGGRSGSTSWAWMTRAELLALKAALDDPDAAFTLTLHDARTFSVIPRREGQGPLSAYPLPVLGERAPADPGSSYRYVVDAIRLMVV